MNQMSGQLTIAIKKEDSGGDPLVYKLLTFILLSVFIMMTHAIQLDREMAVHTLFRAKYALNRSTHAAAQQINPQKLAEGLHSIDEEKARKAAAAYLQSNLQLNQHNIPLAGAFLKSQVDILVFDVINDDHEFPFHYVNPQYDYKVTLRRPGVVMIIRVEYPRTFNMLGPISWNIRGTAELVI